MNRELRPISKPDTRSKVDIKDRWPISCWVLEDEELVDWESSPMNEKRKESQNITAKSQPKTTSGIGVVTVVDRRRVEVVHKR
jgi:hypothetical protein